jgi:hypothetical protein
VERDKEREEEEGKGKGKGLCPGGMMMMDDGICTVQLTQTLLLPE